MQLIFTLVLCFIIFLKNFVHIDSKKYRAIPLDEILPYDLDKSLPPFSTYIDIANINLEQIDDQYLRVKGFAIWIKSTNPKVPIQNVMRSQYFENGKWREGMVKLVVPDMCQEYVNPSRFWYNATKLWGPLCPPQKGDKWIIPEQIVNVTFEIPPSAPLGPWRGYFLVTQGVPGLETLKFGLGFQTEFDLV